MKRSLLFLAVLVSLFFSNCKKDAATNADTLIPPSDQYTLTAQNMANIDGVKNLPNQEQKKIAYSLLLPIEKYGLWLENTRIVSAGFTPQQKLLLVELTAFLTPKLFGDNLDRGKLASFSGNWIEKATKIFTKAQIQSIAYQIFISTDQKNTVQLNAEYGEGGGKACNCSSGSWFDCFDTGYTDEFCLDSPHDCKKPISSGCGFLNLSTCDNLCVYSNGTTDPPKP